MTEEKRKEVRQTFKKIIQTVDIDFEKATIG